MLVIQLPPSIEKKLAKFARRAGKSKASFAREVVMSGIEDLEDVYLAEQTLERIRTGRERTIPLKDVLKRHRW
jgi:RHH-type transcriptional regulator, rel operon repressor / antitoxin RelB